MCGGSGLYGIMTFFVFIFVHFFDLHPFVSLPVSLRVVVGVVRGVRGGYVCRGRLVYGCGGLHWG